MAKKNRKNFRKKFGKKFFLLLKSLENSPRPLGLNRGCCGDFQCFQSPLKKVFSIWIFFEAKELSKKAKKKSKKFSKKVRKKKFFAVKKPWKQPRTLSWGWMGLCSSVFNSKKKYFPNFFRNFFRFFFGLFWKFFRLKKDSNRKKN